SNAIVAPPGVGKASVQVPADEVLFFPTLPVRIDDVKLKVGDEANGQVMTVTNSRLVIDSSLSAEDARTVLKDATVAIKASDQNINATGKVTSVATQPGTNGVDPTKFSVEITPSDAPASLVGASVILTIAVQSTDGAVLAVPVNALAVAAAVAAAVVLAGCGHASNAANSRPIEDQLGFDQAGIQARQAKAETLIRDCMKAQGFDYVPVNPAEQQATLTGVQGMSEADF